jgi:hypothetical protein
VPDEAFAFADRVVSDAFPWAPVLKTGTSEVLAGGAPYVITESLATAIDWGIRLFAAFGYAVFAGEAAPNGPFYVVRLVFPLQVGQLEAHNDGRIISIQATLLAPAGFVTVTVVTSEGFALLRPTTPGTLWDEDTFHAALGRIPTIRASDKESGAVGDLTAGIFYEETIPGFLIDADEALYAALTWEARAHFLALLIRGGIDRRSRTAVVKIIRAARSDSELEALLSSLRQRESYEALFQSVDRELVGMLLHLGQFRPTQPADWQILSALMSEGGPASAKPNGEAPAADLMNRSALSSWLTKAWDRVEAAPLAPGVDRLRLDYVSALIRMVEQANAGDAAAARTLSGFMRNIAGPFLQAIEGAQHANELAGSKVVSAAQTIASQEIVSMLQAALVAELLTWLAAIDAAGPSEPSSRLALMARLSEVNQVFGGMVGLPDDIAADAARLLRALASRTGLDDDARLARVVALLPSRSLAQLVALATAANMPSAEIGERDDARMNGPVPPTADEIAYAIEMASRMEARLSPSDPLTADLAVGLDVLMRFAEQDRAGLRGLIDGIPAGFIGEYMHALRFIRPEHLAAWGPTGLLELAQHPRAMELLRFSGSDVAQAAWLQLRHWEELEQFAGKLEAAHSQSGDPARFQELLVRIARGEAAAFQQVMQVSTGGEDVL